MMSKLKVLDLFKKNYIQFFDELIDLFPDEGDIIIMRIMLSDQIPVSKVMDVFINHILPYKEMVVNRDDTFFIDKFGEFENQLNNTRADLFKSIWNSKVLDEENKKVFWQYFDVLIKLSEKYLQSE